MALIRSTGLAQAAATVTMENLSEIPRGWKFNSVADDKDSITLFVALKQLKLAELKTLLARSGPLRHRDTASHYSRQQMRDYRQPDSNAVDSIMRWLDSDGIGDRQTFDGWISFNLTAQATKSLLDAELGWYSYHTYAPVLRTRRYTVP
jgi:tripeptidyl-peptidase-1